VLVLARMSMAAWLSIWLQRFGCGCRLRLILLLLAGSAFLMGCGDPVSRHESTGFAAMGLVEALGGNDSSGYLRATAPRDFVFPDDHAAHDGFRNEWWYVTGNLDTAEGARIGFHITFFRVALAPEFGGEEGFRGSPWVTRHIWMGHSAITDMARDRHVSEERFAREAVGLAGALERGARVWLEDWSLSGLDSETWQLEFGAGQYRLRLDLQPLREPVLQGDGGLSQKGRESGNASFYYSLPRLRVQGELVDEQGPREVSGQAWLDREWSTSVLEDGQVGWDWFALQFDSGDDLMFYQLRRDDGSTDALSKGRWMPANAADRGLQVEDVDLRPLRHAVMPSGRRYPVVWSMRLWEHGEEWTIAAVRDVQEMDSFIPYWEGAVDILDGSGRLIGRGFVEMTGYDAGLP
jgi:predicted secreted hydrolase